MQLHRLVLSWSGPGVVGAAATVLHFDGTEEAAPPVANVRAAFDSAKLVLPAGVTISFPSAGDTIDDKTGALQGVWSGPAVTPVVGTNPASPMAGVGACITWTTGGIVNGSKGPRKLRGRTFIVPLASAACDAQGTLADPTLALLRPLADSLMASGGLAVWHRPTSAGAADGNSYGVLSNNVRDKLAFLRSRRD